VSGKLVLGCDAPLGGPTKLLRKIFFVPPEEKAVPRLYTAAADLSQGARVVVLYGETIMLYSIPPDVIAYSQMERTANGSNAQPSGDCLPKNHWLRWWDEPPASDNTQIPDTNEPNTTWPISIRGTEIGKLKHVCELAVQTRPDITVWAFTHSSQCKSWRLRNYMDPISRKKQHVCRDGLVHDSYLTDEVRDIIMTDAPSPSRSRIAIDLPVCGAQDELPSVERPVILGLDGDASGIMKKMPRALAVENDDWVDMVDVRGCSDA
jgi:hypothetical protein